MEAEPKPGIGVCTPCKIFCKSGAAEAFYQIDLINRTAVVRDPYARWRGGAARLLPIPMSQLPIHLIYHLIRWNVKKSNPLIAGGPKNELS